MSTLKIDESPSVAARSRLKQSAEPDASRRDHTRVSWFTIRHKLFIAFTVLAIVGGSGGLLSLFSLHDIARTYQKEQSEVSVHEALHEDRIALLSILNLINRYPSQPAQEQSDARTMIEKRMLQLDTSTQMCHGCHSHLPTHAEFNLQLDELRQRLALLLQPPADPSVGSGVYQRSIEDSIQTLQDSRSRMEERFHQLLDHRREQGKNILQPTLWQQLAMVLGGLAVALALALLLSRALVRPILPLIAAARRIGSGNISHPIEVPLDPDLAPVAVALNEMAALVAQQAREDARRQLLDHTISSQEDERRRIARELHDVLGQSLSALLMEIKSQSVLAEIPHPPMDGNGMQARVSSLLDEVHRMAWDLRPSLLDDLGLNSALHRYAEDMARRYKKPIDIQAVGLDQGQERLPGNIETVLYRVAQEALNNVMRHAQANRASIVLVRRASEVVLLVEDDGSGFDVEAIRRARASLGILGMEERITLVGGDLTIVSIPGEGTSLRAQIPLSGFS